MIKAGEQSQNSDRHVTKNINIKTSRNSSFRDTYPTKHLASTKACKIALQFTNLLQRACNHQSRMETEKEDKKKPSKLKRIRKYI